MNLQRSIGTLVNLTQIQKVRSIIVEKLNGQIRWANKNKFSCESGEKIKSTEFVATTWVHYDVRAFEAPYLKDRFFKKTTADLIGNTKELT